MDAMVTLVAVIYLAAAGLQVVAAVLAVRALPHTGAFRYVWVALSLALMLMVQRRVAPLLRLNGSAADLGDACFALAISGLLVVSLLGLSRLLHAIRASQDQLRRLAVTDPLTGLANRRHILSEIEKEWRRAERTRKPLAVLMADIDHFKEINDRHGHAVGDEVLVALAKRCRSRLREIDACGRLGGEEFVVLLPETGAEGARATAERLRSEVGGAPVATSDGPVRVTISVGVALYEPSADFVAPAAASGRGARAVQALLEKADRALYRAKDTGRDRVVMGVPDEVASA
jgi:diguanylate cyclase (GGDEF)-like protein